MTDPGRFGFSDRHFRLLLFSVTVGEYRRVDIVVLPSTETYDDRNEISRFFTETAVLVNLQPVVHLTRFGEILFELKSVAC